MRLFRRIARSVNDFEAESEAVYEERDARGCAAVVLCLREAGFGAEAEAYEDAWVNARVVDDLAEIGLPFTAHEFAEKYLRPWMEAGGEETERFAQLKQSLLERRQVRARSGTTDQSDEFH